MLKGVSRSFYLSLRLLPRPMRGAASLAYLLARTSDTIADTAAAPVDLRQRSLDEFERALTSGNNPPRWPAPLLNVVTDPREHQLLENTAELIAWLGRLPADEAALVREVVAIIIGGQKLDLARFVSASREKPIALEDDDELEDYAWRVAGCVGAFWTKLGFLTMADGFSRSPESNLIDKGVAYGKGLQLVNILRDLPADLATGRCYLPVSDPRDISNLLDMHRRWVERASGWIDAGFSHAGTLRSRRARAATILPAMIARETLDRLRGADWETLQERIKIPRSRVYLAMARALGGARGV
jgi:farnesyl-diphosphate farnesyltransferase